MSSSNIFGWLPSGDEDEVVSSDLRSTSPSSSSYEDTESRSARRADPNRVARPRNPFIIFRCKWVKEHARGAQSTTSGARRASSVDIDRTMSKRAGNAWNALPKSEQAHYIERAKIEKAEHAAAHPGYQYKPKKGNAAAQPKKSKAAARPKKRKAAARRRRNQRSHPPPQAVADSSKSVDSRLDSESPEESPSGNDGGLGSASVASPVGQLGQVTPKKLNRRSTSMSSLFPPLVLTPEQRLGMRRTKSDLQTVSTVLASPPSSVSSASDSYDLLYPSSPDHVSPLEIGSPTPTVSSFKSSYQTPPPFATVASSLTGWNGDPTPIAMPMERISSMASTSSLLQTHQPESSPMSWSQYQPSYEMPAHFRVLYPPSNVFWDPLQEGSSAMGSNDSGMAFDPTMSAAMHNYHLGLATQVQPQTAGDYMMFDVPVAEEQRFFEGFVHF